MIARRRGVERAHSRTRTLPFAQTRQSQNVGLFEVYIFPHITGRREGRGEAKATRDFAQAAGGTSIWKDNLRIEK